MKRFILKATVSIDIKAEDEESAYGAFYDAIDELDCESLDVPAMELAEVPYAVPPGAERWAEGLVALRFGEDTLMFGMFDGSWWFTNGHVALRCDGEMPSCAMWMQIPDATLEASLRTAPKVQKVQATDWRERGVEADRGNVTVNVRRATSNPDVAIAQQYYALVANGLPDAKWHIGGPEDLILAHDAKGDLMAVAMGILVKPWAGSIYRALLDEQIGQAAE